MGAGHQGRSMSDHVQMRKREAVGGGVRPQGESWSLDVDGQAEHSQGKLQQKLCRWKLKLNPRHTSYRPSLRTARRCVYIPDHAGGRVRLLGWERPNRPSG